MNSSSPSELVTGVLVVRGVYRCTCLIIRFVFFRDRRMRGKSGVGIKQDVENGEETEQLYVFLILCECVLSHLVRLALVLVSLVPAPLPLVVAVILLLLQIKYTIDLY